jgi:hypothetical protein
MAILAPPPPTESKRRAAPPSTAQNSSAPGRDPHWKEKLTRSGYFLGAVLLHLVIFLMVAAWVVFQPPKAPPSDFQQTYVRTTPPATPPPTPPSLRDQVQLPSPASQAPAVIVTPSPRTSFLVSPPSPDATLSLDVIPNRPAPAKITLPNGLGPRLPGILRFIERGQKRDPDNILHTGGDPHNYVGTFPVYLAAYADGDWSCNVTLNNGAVQAGSLPDLIAKMKEWSHGKMNGTVVPTPLDIGGPDLMDKAPPFIFFTGHKDFKLTDQEVRNLQDYLENGGLIWGDNCLPGYGSRFDVAFHREMKRVVPDLDKNFEKVPMDYPIFTKSWSSMSQLPSGMNYYDEPLEHLDLDGKLAIIYTPNDYSDLFCMRILPGDKMAEGWQPAFGSGSPLFTFGSFGSNATIFFRNFTLPASLEAHRLGMNIIGYLLIRFDPDLLLNH